MSNVNYKDLVGQKFGKLTVVERVGSKVSYPSPKSKRKRPSFSVLWSCKCDCGNEKTITSNNLQNTESCGCLWRNNKGRVRKGYENGKAAKNIIRDYYKRAAKLRNLDWQLTDDQFFNLTKQNCHYCGIEPSKIRETGAGFYIYNGIDRKENSTGYTVTNTVSCCEMCNLAKRDVPYPDFLEYLMRITKYQEKLQFQTYSQIQL